MVLAVRIQYIAALTVNAPLTMLLWPGSRLHHHRNMRPEMFYGLWLIMDNVNGCCLRINRFVLGLNGSLSEKWFRSVKSTIKRLLVCYVRRVIIASVPTAVLCANGVSGGPTAKPRAHRAMER